MLLDNDVGLLLGGDGVFVLRVAPPPRLAEDETALDTPTPCTTNAGECAIGTPTPLPTKQAVTVDEDEAL